MNIKNLAASEKAHEEQEPSELIEEKPLDGSDNPVLRKIRLLNKRVNNIRLCISSAGVKTSTVFGGEIASFISPIVCDDYYAQIDEEDEFYSLSERIRERLLMVI